MQRPKAPTGPTIRGAAAAGGCVIAAAGLTSAFRGADDRFWGRMTRLGARLAALALATDPRLRRTRIGGRDVAAGLAIAAGLRAAFGLGDRFARRWVPGAGRDIEAIYERRRLQPRLLTAGQLILVVGPAEELFWRGLVQDALAERYGRLHGAALATVGYAGAHVATGNLTLVGAAGTAGACWSGLRAAGVPLGALVVSHAAWDVWIFLLSPTAPVGASPR